MRRWFSIFKAAFLERNINIEILLASMKTLILILTILREFIPFFCGSFATMRDSGRLIFLYDTRHQNFVTILSPG
jgi:hypothetical protein